MIVPLNLCVRCIVEIRSFSRRSGVRLEWLLLALILVERLCLLVDFVLLDESIVVLVELPFAAVVTTQS